MSARLRMPSAALAAALVLVVPACGGTAAPTLYAVQPTADCLDQSGIRVRQDDLDFVASTALAGALHGDLGTNEVTVAFGETPEEAQRLESAYRTFAGEQIPIDYVLMRDRNAVLLWNAPPSPDDRDRVTACLRA